MGAVGGVAILGGNFEAPTFPEDKVVQRSLTVGDQEASAIDAIIIDAPALGAPGQVDSHAMLWKGHSNDGSPHTIDWKLFVDVTADDGTGSLWTLQTRIDAAPFSTVMTIDDNGLLTVSGATFTMDQLIIDSDNTEAVLIRKDGDAGDVFIVDTVNDVVRMGSDATTLTFGASSDVIFRREAAGIISLVDPGSSIASGTQQEFRIWSFDAIGEERYLELIADRSGNGEVEIRARRAGGGGQYDLIFDVDVGALEFWNEGVQRWSIPGSVTADFEILPQITNRYDVGNSTFAVRNIYTHGVIFGTTPASTGSIRLQNTDSIVFRNAGDDGDLEFISSPQSDEFDLFDNANIPRVRFKNVHTEFDGRVTINTGTSTAQLIVGANTLLVDTTNNIVTNSGGTIRGSNPNAYALRDLESSRTVPTVIANRAELTTGIGGTDSQEISLIVDAIEAVRVDGGQRVRVLRNGVTLDRPARTTDGFDDSHDLLWVGKGFESATPHNIDWKAFVDVTANDGTGSIWTLQTRIDAGSFVDRLTIADASLTMGLPDDVAAIHLGASGDTQLHRGDAADIWEQRRGANPQEWRLYDRFVSHSDYDRLAVYIGGGPPLKTIEFVAESTNASQGISIEIEALPGGSSDGLLSLINGSVRHTITPSSHSFTGGTVNISTPSTTSLTVNNFISSIGVGTGTPGIGIKLDIAGQGASAFADSHSFDMIGAGELGNRATWRTFVDVIDVGANSIWTLQDDKNGGGFETNFSITDDGGFNFPQPLPSHAIGTAIDLSSQLTLSGDYFSLLSGGTTASRFKTEDRLTAATGQTVGQFLAWFGGNIRTQTATESVANIATVSIDEPQITDQLTGGGLITNAQSLLITGAPTEGVSNYAQRILGGDLQIANASAFLFRNAGDDADLTALSVATTDFLEIGGVGAADFERVIIYSGSSIQLTPDNDVRVITDDSGGFAVRNVTPGVLVFRVNPIAGSENTRAIGSLTVAASIANNSAETEIQSTFADVLTSSGSSVTAVGLIPAGSFVFGVTVRVLTLVTGPSGFDVGDGIDVDRWGNSISSGALTTTDITDFTSGAVTTFQAANDVVLTSDGVDFTGGEVRITVHYLTLTTSII